MKFISTVVVFLQAISLIAANCSRGSTKVSTEGLPKYSQKGSPKGTTKVTPKMLEAVFHPCGQENTNAKGQNITCGKAADYINKALAKYNLNAPAQVAFFLSIISVESGNLTFNKNVWPGRPGKGTRSMMMPINLHAFLKDSPEILASHPSLRSIAEKPYDDTNDKAKTDVLDVLMQPEYSFEPGAWWIQKGAEKMQPGCTRFYSTLESEVTITTLDALLKSCVGVDSNEARRQAFETALKAITTK
ncbi:hypothetical protein DSO57_1011666 [Entomophthora muscae]|uniref:Uncharacterized protein n=1 Tax=Entomophthora muscae TaxID=34485 RepID=A0ACC2RX78_9FUNG|nr:hypothetical protein DSO57_1011666 [Entomophthora muscae]